MAAGIRVHRQIDKFTDAHPIWRRSRERFEAPARRFAGVAVDVLYDHFLAAAWDRYSDQHLASFSEAVYAGVAQYEALFTPRLRRVFRAMREGDWLVAYADFEHVRWALERMSMRSIRLAGLRATIGQAAANLAALRQDFHEFFPQLADHAVVLRRSS